MTALKRLFGEGFRVFFLAAGLFALVAIGLWLAVFLGLTELPAAPPPHLWHAHEMIFGYGSAALGGFLLTAAPNWTGAKAAPHRFIAAVAALWFLGRIAVFASAHLPPVLVALADLGFVPVLGLNLLLMLLKKPKPQQMILLAILALFWAGNLMVHLEWMGLTDDSTWAGLRVGLLALAALIMVLGGRVTPGFTRNAMVQSGREDGLPWNPMPLAALAIAAALTQPVGYLLHAPEALLAPLALVAGLAGLVRVALWRGLWTLGRPILWTLHLSYALNAAGFVALGLAGWGLTSELAALHLLGIGGVGGMTLAVMSRASLGHSGRPLVAPRPVALAYALLPLAALARIIGATVPGLVTISTFFAGSLWLLAFALYVIALWPVFVGPRAPRPPVTPPRS